MIHHHCAGSVCCCQWSSSFHRVSFSFWITVSCLWPISSPAFQMLFSTLLPFCTHRQLLVVNISHCICPCADGLASCQTIHSELAGVAHRVLQVLCFGGFYFSFFFPWCNLNSLQSKAQYCFFAGEGVKEQAVQFLSAFSLLIEPRIIQTRGTTFCSGMQLGV